MTPSVFIKELSSVKIENTFNPYSDRCAIHDIAEAPRIRKSLLLSLVEAAVKQGVESIWVGRDLGYRGGRRTGLALTDDLHLIDHGRRWGVSAKRATKGSSTMERTAAIIWGALAEINSPIFLWNVFPFHPHEPNDQFSNRSHNAKERAIGEEFLYELILLISPIRLIAVGNDAALSLRRILPSREIVQVRHPSYGGHKEFQRQIAATYKAQKHRFSAFEFS